MQKPQRLGLLAGIFLAAGLVMASMVVTRTWLRIAEGQTVSVTGLARRAIQSDLIVWRGTFATESETLLRAQEVLKEQAGQVSAFLKAHGLTNYLMAPIGISEIYARQRQNDNEEASSQKVVGYRLSQTVEVRSPEVDRVLRVMRQTSTLVEQGIAFVSAQPEFIYTRAGEAKVEMLAEAIQDAKARAEQIVGPGGRKLGPLRSARMGVFQITPAYSTATSWEGINDTTSQEKTMSATVTATFSME
ncbi:MAG TPA: SIMPL domain-containing protein [Candidatus Paceibacterota bacterium]|nr:SIMPL domain-containing protein [Verrucomicrobiota bacterium]HRY50536.1 SIMPL domain-containing protein [Candidatus Paceibacterota bacterium]